MTESGPELFGDVRREWSDELDERLDFIDVRRALAGAQRLHVLHHRGDGRVVAQLRDVLRHFPDRLVQLAHHRRIGVSRPLGLDRRAP